jgi:integrase
MQNDALTFDDVVEAFEAETEKPKACLAAKLQARVASGGQQRTKTPPSRDTAKHKGLFEKVPGSGVWFIRYADATGRIRREKVGTWSNANDLYHKRKNEVLQGRKLPEKLRARKILFAELADDRLRYLEAHNEAGAIPELRTDAVRINRLKEEFGAWPAELPIEKLREWFAGQDWAPGTFNRYKTVLSAIYRLGIENERVSVNPARLLKHASEGDGRVRFLSKVEEENLRAAIRAECPQHEVELDIALHTGMRRSEQYRRISWREVDFERRDLYVPRSKKVRSRHIELNDTALSAFRELYRRTDGKDPIFANQRNGEPVLGPRHWFEDAVKKAELEDFTWHDLRHTFGSRLAMAGVPLRHIADLMGHATIQMTMKYAHLAPSYKLDAVRKLDSFGTSGVVSRLKPTDTKTGTEENGQFLGSGKSLKASALGR